jgi:hypothetical protein
MAAARGIRLTDVSCTVSGDFDLYGVMGLDPRVCTG